MGMVFRPRRARRAQEVYSVMLCVLAPEGLDNPRDGKFLQLLLKREAPGSHSYRVSIETRQFVHLFIHSTGNEYDVLDSELGADDLDGILASCHSALIEQLKKAVTDGKDCKKVTKRRKAKSTATGLESALDSTYWRVHGSREQRAKRANAHRDPVKCATKSARLCNEVHKKVPSKRASVGARQSSAKEDVEDDELAEKPPAPVSSQRRGKAPRAEARPSFLPANNPIRCSNAVKISSRQEFVEVYSNGWEMHHYPVPPHAAPSTSDEE